MNRHGFPISARIIIRTYYKLRSDLSEHVREVSFRAGKGEESSLCSRLLGKGIQKNIKNAVKRLHLNVNLLIKSQLKGSLCQ